MRNEVISLAVNVLDLRLQGHFELLVGLGELRDVFRLFKLPLQAQVVVLFQQTLKQTMTLFHISTRRTFLG